MGSVLDKKKKKIRQRRRNSVTSVVTLLLVCIMPIGLMMIDDVRSDVYLAGYELTENGKLNLEIYVAGDGGYVRKVTTTRKDGGLYLDFHSTTGIKNPNGAKTEYSLSIADSIEAIYIYRGRKTYEQVLEKVGNKWVEFTES